MSAFTPAPWKLRIEPYEDDPFPGKDFFVLRFGDDIITGITEPANAQLMAAAPELYEALAICLEARKLIEEGDYERLPNFGEWEAKAHEALAKARGNQ